MKKVNSFSTSKSVFTSTSNRFTSMRKFQINNIQSLKGGAGGCTTQHSENGGDHSGDTITTGTSVGSL